MEDLTYDLVKSEIWYADDYIYIQNKSKIAVLSYDDMLTHVTKSTIDRGEIMATFIKCATTEKYLICDDSRIVCDLTGTLEHDTLEFTIPSLIFRDSEDTHHIDSFTVLKDDDTIIFKDNNKYTKLVILLSDLYQYMQSAVKYPSEIFRKVVVSHIENEASVKKTIELVDLNYVIAYSWDGIVCGSFDLIIPVVDLKFDSDRIMSDFKNIPESNVIINMVNNILFEYTEEKEKTKLEDLTRELVHFKQSMDLITSFDTIFHKLGRL